MGVSSQRLYFTPQLGANSTLSSHRKWPLQAALLVPTELNRHIQVGQLADSLHIQVDQRADSLHILEDRPVGSSHHM